MKLGEWESQKYINNNGFGGKGYWGDGEKITFKNCTIKQKKHCSVEQLINIESQKKYKTSIKLVKTGRWGNKTFYKIISKN